MANQSKYFRISVTDRCNLSCFFCHNEGQQEVEPSEPLTIDSLEFVCGIAKDEGFTKFKLTGGEPTIRADIGPLVEKLSSLGLEDFSMITNGSTLLEKAALLKESGLQRLNVSLHTLNPEKFKAIQRGAKTSLDQIIRGIDSALKVGFTTMKINFVYIDEENSDEDLFDMLRYVSERSLTLVILPVISMKVTDPLSSITLNRLYEKIKVLGIKHEEHLIDEEGINKLHIQLYSGAKVLLRVDELADHKPYVFCELCTTKDQCREGIFPLRLSADGVLIPCLASQHHRISIREAIESYDIDSARRAIQRIREWKLEDGR